MPGMLGSHQSQVRKKQDDQWHVLLGGHTMSMHKSHRGRLAGTWHSFPQQQLGLGSACLRCSLSILRGRWKAVARVTAEPTHPSPGGPSDFHLGHEPSSHIFCVHLLPAAATPTPGEWPGAAPLTGPSAGAAVASVNTSGSGGLRCRACQLFHLGWEHGIPLLLAMGKPSHLAETYTS